MGRKLLRLRNDPPYPGESLSSFLERTAQFYCTHFDALLGQLMEGHGWSAKGRRDLDLNPPDVLQSRLADSVQDWRSPLTEHRGFHGWVMAPSLRHAYCPICFSMDLAGGDTPYFRMDWAAACVTICWYHGTPLLEWKYRDCRGRRRLPQAWLYRKRHEEVVWPEFFTEHCRLLQRLNEQVGGEKRLAPVDIFDYLYGLQVAIEKRSAGRMKIYPQAQDPKSEMRALAGALLLAVARDRSVLYVRSNESHVLSMDYGWFGLKESDIPRYAECDEIDAFRQMDALEWRRAFLLFAARTLAGSNRYGQTIVSNPAAERPWRALWSDSLWREGEGHWDDDFEQLKAMWSNHLDEQAPPGHGLVMGGNHGPTRPTPKWIWPWLDNYVLEVWRKPPLVL